MHTNDAILDLAATAQPLPRRANGFIAALGRSRFIDAADGLGMVMVVRDQLLGLVTDAFLVPLD
jgi:hypothetical protein